MTAAGHHLLGAGEKSWVVVSAGSANASSVAVSGGVLADDICIGFGLNIADATIPSIPTDFLNINTEVRSTFAAGRLVYRKALTNGEFSNTGVFTNATKTAYILLRPVNGEAVIGPTTKTNTTNGTTVNTPALTTPDAESYCCTFSGMIAATTYTGSGVIHTVEVALVSTNRIGVHGKNPSAGSFVTQALITAANSGGAVAISVEVEFAP